jgi:MFS family permease
LLRESLVEMDVPTRQSYVMAVVEPTARTFAAGITQLVRLSGWAIAPFFAGFLIQGVTFAMPLFIGAGMKILYNLALDRAFQDINPPEE